MTTSAQLPPHDLQFPCRTAPQQRLVCTLTATYVANFFQANFELHPNDVEKMSGKPVKAPATKNRPATAGFVTQALGRCFNINLIIDLIRTYGCIIPVRIRVRIDPPHPLLCRKRRLSGAVPRMRPEIPRSRVTAGVTLKIPPCLKALSAEHRPKFCNPSPAMVSEKFLSGT
jgi:hypothetical protein